MRRPAPDRLALLSIVCCLGSPASSCADAGAVSRPGSAAPAQAAPGAGSEAPPQAHALVIDAQRSELRFTISRPGETIDGHAHTFDGTIRFDPARPGEGSSVTLSVQADSLETGNRLRDRKMRGRHLETDRFPSIRFRSTAVTLSKDAVVPASDGVAPPSDDAAGKEGRHAARALVEGVVSLHGVDRTILFPAVIRYDSASFTAEGEFAVRLTDHDIAIPRFLWIVLDDEVRVYFRFEAR